MGEFAAPPVRTSVRPSVRRSVRLSASCLCPPFRAVSSLSLSLFSSSSTTSSSVHLLRPPFFLLPPLPPPRPSFSSSRARRLLPLSKSPAETRYMQEPLLASRAHGHTWPRCIRMREACCTYQHRRLRVHARVSSPCSLLFVAALRRRYDTIFGQRARLLRGDVRLLSRRDDGFLVGNVELA